MTNINGEYPVKNSTIIMFFVMVGLIISVGIDILFFPSSDASSDEIQTVETQTVETYELPKEEPKEPKEIEF